MSISPQSLAKTRDKRSLRVPRKFEDFEDEYIPGNYAAALRLKGSKPTSSKRHLHKDISSNSITDNSGGSSSKKMALAASPEVAPPVPAKTSRPPPRQRSSTPAVVEQVPKESPPTSTTTSPSPTPTATASSATVTSTVTITTNAAAAATAAIGVGATPGSTTTTSTTTTAINTDVSLKVDRSKNISTPEIAKLLTNDSRTNAKSNQSYNDESGIDTVPSNLFEIDLECKETAPANIDIETKDEEKILTDETSLKNEEFVTPSLILRTTGEPTVDLTNISAENLDKTILNAIRKSDDSVFKKSPFHPSITISNGVRLGGSSTKSSNEKTKLSSVSILSSQSQISKSSNTTSSSSSSSSSSRKRSRGFSLMVKPPAVQNGTAPNQTSNTTNNSNSSPFQNNTNRPNQQQPQVQVQQQPTKYFNSLTQNMQYGARLMLNEPVYLPKSVPTIAPITNTLIHIANQARKPPYLTKRAEKYYAYQEERKMNILLSNYQALTRVTQHLEATDLVNLKMVNKTWKSIIDCDDVWRKVVLKRSHICNWMMFAENILQKCRVKEITLDEYETGISAEEICLALAGTDLHQIFIRTVNENQSTVAIELLSGLNKGTTAARINWKVKVVVDDNGLALVPILRPTPKTDEELDTITAVHLDLSDYLLSVCQDSPSGDDGIVLVELNDLRSLFNDGENDEYKTGLFSCKPCIIIEPI